MKSAVGKAAGVSLVFGLVLLMSACSSASESPSPGTGFLNLDNQPKSTVTLTVHFRPSATTLEMARVFEDLNSALSNGGFADLPTESSAFYEDHRMVMGWASVSAAQRGESRARSFLDRVPIVERIEVERR